MVLINKEEKEFIQQRCPDMTFVRTVRQKSKRHHYYMTETPKAMRLLNQVRYGIQPERQSDRRHGRSRR